MSNSIKQVLNEFLDNSSSKSLLIDGPWGCGKTYTIKEYIKNRKPKRLVYISLFGMETIDEINLNLYKSSQKIKRILFGVGKTVPQLIKIIPKAKDVVEGLENQLRIKHSGDIKKGTIIVFDDLERISDKISYYDLLGYFNKLFMLNCRIVCLISTQFLIKQSNNKYQDFCYFKEKVFDTNFNIVSTNNEIFDSIFSKYNIDGVDSLYFLFNSNIRQAYKLSYFYDSIAERVKTRVSSFDSTPHNPLTVLRACMYAIMICLNPPKRDSQEAKDMDENDENANSRIVYQELRRVKELDNYKTDFLVPGFYDLVFSLINIYMFRRYEEFDAIMFISEKNKDKTLLDYVYFYLSDDEKRQYELLFHQELLNGNISWDYKGRNIIRTLFADDYPFKDDEIVAISSAIANCDDKDEKDHYFIEFGIEHMQNPSDNQKYFYEKLKKTVSSFIVNDTIESFKNLYSLKNYSALSLTIGKIGLCNSIEEKGFLDNVVKNNFYLPDISGTIDESIWHYCHSMAKFACINNKGREFVEYAKSVCKGSDNKSLVDRYYALILYNINDRINTKMLIDEKESIELLFK